MSKYEPEHIYLKNDIDRAFNMGLETAVSAFERTIGLTPDNQRYILSRIKNMFIEDKAAAVIDKN